MSTNPRTPSIDKSNAEAANSRWHWLYKFSSAAALGAGGLFLIGAVDLVLTILYADTLKAWFSLFQSNWLLVIFKLHAGFSGIQADLLYRLNPLDLMILALIAIAFLGLYLALRGTSKIWSLIALVQPFLGIVLLVGTKSVGRSGVMGAELVISAVMLRSRLFDKRTAYLGMLSGALLLAGDIGASMAPSMILATLTGIGYLLLITWFFLVAGRLFRLGLDDRGAAL